MKITTRTFMSIGHKLVKKRVVELEIHEAKALVNQVMELSYNRSTDIYEVPSELMQLHDDLSREELDKETSP